jgi:hypothetical protein
MEMQYSDELRQPGGSRARGRISVPAEQLDRIVSALAEQFTLLYEANPTDPYATFGGGVLTFAFQGGFTVLDKSRLATGRAEEVRDFRERFLQAVAEELNEVVEANVSSTRVSFFFAAFDVAARTTNCFFVLDPVADSEREQHEAILAWSEQVRRSARGLRTRTRHARKATLHIARGFTALPRESDFG